MTVYPIIVAVEVTTAIDLTQWHTHTHTHTHTVG